VGEGVDPAQAARANEKTIARILKAHHVRRFDAAEVLRILRQQPLAVATGTVEAATATSAPSLPA
jgi:hypothetical protein